MPPVVVSAAQIYLKSLDELLEAESKKNDLGIRQAAEKAWLAVVQATDSFLSRHGVRVDPTVRAHVERRRHLRSLGKDDWLRTYSSLADTLHGEIFYMGEEVTPDLLRRYFVDAANLIEECTGATRLVSTTYEEFRRLDKLLAMRE
jgi:hypothetical protein